MNCIWCDTPFERRTTGGSPQRYCSADCRLAFHLAARRWAEKAVVDGVLTAAELRNSPVVAYTLAGSGKSGVASTQGAAKGLIESQRLL